jgi:glc operon protein GlcG
MKTKLLFLFTILSFYAVAQKEPYGESVTLEQAKKMLSAAEAFALKNQWTVVIAIVDTGGNLVLLEKIDNTQIGSIDIAIAKAKTANNFKRSTKVFEDAVTKGGVGLRVLNVPGMMPLEGGEPILLNGKVIGGIGVSGMASGQDEEVVNAGLAALK